MATWSELQNKYGGGKTQNPATPSPANSASWDTLKTRYQNYQAPAATPPPTPGNRFLKTMKGAVKGAADFVAGSEIGTGKAIGSILAAPQESKGDTQMVNNQSEYLKTLNDLKNKSAAAGQDTSHYDALIASNQPRTATQPNLPSATDTAVDLGGTAADVLTAGTYGKAVEGAKFGQLMAKKAPSAIAPVLEKVASSAAKNVVKSSEKITAKIADAITPRLTPTKAGKAAQFGKLSGPKMFEQAGIDVSKSPEIARSVEGIKGVAQSLGKKATDIVKSGTGQAINNANRLGQAVVDYAQKVVSPMLKESPAQFEFSTLRKSMEMIKPAESLANKTSVATYNRIRERLLGVAADAIRKTGRVSPVSDFNDIWDARKAIDQVITEELGVHALDPAASAGVKGVAADMRGAFKQFLSDSYRYSGQMEKVNAMNDFIKASKTKGIQISEDMLPTLRQQFGIVEDPAKKALSDQWDKHMENMSGIYDAISNVATRAKTEYGKTYPQLFEKDHPYLKKIIDEVPKGIGAALGIGGVYEAGKTVGVWK